MIEKMFASPMEEQRRQEHADNILDKENCHKKSWLKRNT